MKVVNDEYGRPTLKFVSTGIISSPEGPRLGFKAKNVGSRALDVHFGLRPMLGRIYPAKVMSLDEGEQLSLNWDMGRHSDTEQEIELMVSYINPSDRKGHHRMAYTLRKDGSGPHGWTISDY